MVTECKQESFEFQGLGSRKVEARFDGGTITSDGGALLFGEVAKRRGILDRFAGCFDDHRNPDLIEFTVRELVAQRVYGLICGYEDLNDHQILRSDPLLASLVGKEDVTGEKRVRREDKGKALAGKSTLNRIELAKREFSEEERYKKIICDEKKVENFFIEEFIRSFKKSPRFLILDFDAKDMPLHGNQEDKFYHGYYGHYCYLPLYVFCNDMPLYAKLRPSNIDASLGTIEALEKIVPCLKEAFPKATILVRADSGFAREEIMSWCERNEIHYILGLAKNSRLLTEIQEELKKAKEEFEKEKRPARIFKELEYQTRESWSKPRRVIAKAEHLEKGENPRFIVTSLSEKASKAMKLYEKWYCQRGDMENRIKEQLHLFADRMSAGVKRANQLRLWFSTVAYLIMTLTRRLTLKNTDLARARMNTIRGKLIKIGAQVTVSVRRVFVSMASCFPYQHIFRQAHLAALQI